VTDQNGVRANEHAGRGSNTFDIHDRFIELILGDAREAGIDVALNQQEALTEAGFGLEAYSTGTCCLTISSSTVAPLSSTIVTLASDKPAVVSIISSAFVAPSATHISSHSPSLVLPHRHVCRSDPVLFFHK
jgi:hypothetical protein